MAEITPSQSKKKYPVLTSVLVTLLILAGTGWYVAKRLRKNAITIVNPDILEYTLLDTDKNIVIEFDDATYLANRQAINTGISRIKLNVPTKANNFKGLVYRGRSFRIHNYYNQLSLVHNGDIIMMHQLEAVDFKTEIIIDSYSYCDFIYDDKKDKWYCFYDKPFS